MMMMTADESNKSPVRFHVFISVFLLVSVATGSSSQCVDGTYQHDGRDCCMCAIGQRVLEHCITHLEYGKCELCEPETYSSHPTGQMSCEPCTSCSQPNENLEEDEQCIPSRDRKCRCKEDHYCTSHSQICRLCQPCQKCAEGVKVACTSYNNTVCNDKIEGGNHVGRIVGIIIGIIGFIAVVGVAVYFWKKRGKKQNMSIQQPNGNATDVEMPILEDVDLQPHLTDIAETIGWKDMKIIAMRSNMPSTVIDSFLLSFPNDSQTQTLELLKDWVEKQGSQAGKNLIQVLQESGKKGKAQKVKAILAHGT